MSLKICYVCGGNEFGGDISLGVFICWRCLDRNRGRFSEEYRHQTYKEILKFIKKDPNILLCI